MGRKVKQIMGYSSDQIKSLFNSEDKYKTGLRLYAVYQVSLGQSSRNLESLYNTSFKQILNWVDRFEKNGIDGLKDCPRSGRNPRLSAGQKQELKKIVIEQSPLDYGFNTDTWTGPIISEVIERRYEVSYKKAQVYNILKSLGLTYQKSKGFYPEANKNHQEKFKEDLKKTS